MERSIHGPLLAVGTAVTARYKGAYCEARVVQVDPRYECQVVLQTGRTWKGLLTDVEGFGPSEDCVELRAGATVRVRPLREASAVSCVGKIKRIQNRTRYTVEFCDGDRLLTEGSKLKLMGGKHYSDNLDEMPLYDPTKIGVAVSIPLEEPTSFNSLRQKSTLSSRFRAKSPTSSLRSQYDDRDEQLSHSSFAFDFPRASSVMTDVFDNGIDDEDEPSRMSWQSFPSSSRRKTSTPRATKKTSKRRESTSSSKRNSPHHMDPNGYFAREQEGASPQKRRKESLHIHLNTQLKSPRSSLSSMPSITASAGRGSPSLNGDEMAAPLSSPEVGSTLYDTSTTSAQAELEVPRGEDVEEEGAQLDMKPQMDELLPPISSSSSSSCSTQVSSGASGTSTESESKKTTKFLCDECPYSTNNSGSLHHHLLRHQKPMRYWCSLCTFSAGTRQSVKLHFRDHGRAARGLAPLDRGAELEQLLRERIVKAASESPPRASLEDEDDEDEDEDDEVEEEKKTGKTENERIVVTIGAKRGEEETFILDLTRMRKIAQRDPEVEAAMWKGEREERESTTKCPECPFKEDDETLMRLHQELHGKKKRPFECNCCTYSCYTPEALYHHLSLHTPNPVTDISRRPKLPVGKRLSSEELVPKGKPHYACSRCAYRTLSENCFNKHNIGHAEILQQKMLTLYRKGSPLADEPQISRTRRRRRVPRPPVPLFCSRCSFRCDTMEALDRHMELHGQDARFACSICDYSSSSRLVVEFHTRNHHADVTLAGLRRQALLDPGSTKCKIDVDWEAEAEGGEDRDGETWATAKRLEMVGHELRCRRCDYRTFEIRLLSDHWRAEHVENEHDAKVADYLSMGLVSSASFFNFN